MSNQDLLVVCIQHNREGVGFIVFNHVRRLTRLYDLPVTYLPDILNKPVITHCYMQDCTRRCMSGSKLWLAEWACFLQ